MTRLIGLSLLALSFTFAACGSSDKKKDEPAVVAPMATMSPDQALIGTWQDGSNTFVFGADKSFRWMQARPCGSPPCPTTTSTGTYELRHGQIKVTLDGADEMMNMSFNADQSQLSLQSNKRSQNWGLMRGN